MIPAGCSGATAPRHVDILASTVRRLRLPPWTSTVARDPTRLGGFPDSVTSSRVTFAVSLLAPQTSYPAAPNFTLFTLTFDGSGRAPAIRFVTHGRPGWESIAAKHDGLSNGTAVQSLRAFAFIAALRHRVITASGPHG